MWMYCSAVLAADGRLCQPRGGVRPGTGLGRGRPPARRGRGGEAGHQVLYCAALYCTVLHCTALYCPVPGESQLDGFLCWLLPVSPCTVTIHSSSTSLALDYVITLPTTTTTQGAGGDIQPPHRAQEVIYYPAQTPPHLIFVFNPSTTFKHFITIY